MSQSRYQQAFTLLRSIWTNLETLAQKPGSVVPLSDLALSLLPIIAEGAPDTLNPDEIAFLNALVSALDSAGDTTAAIRADRAVILKATFSKLIPKAAASPSLRSRLASLLGRELTHK